MHIAAMEHLMECELAQAVQSHYPLDWKEDAITHDLLIRLRRIGSVTLEGLWYPLQVEWEIYKLHGARETCYGDIGVLVRHRLPSGPVIEAAGFLEAKIRGRDSRTFPQVRHEQIDRILARSRYTRLLLYDYNAVPVLTNDGVDPGWEWGPFPFQGPAWTGQAMVTHGPTVPLELASAVKQFDDGLYRFANSFSNQMVRRFFRLHDVDFSKQAVEAVKGFPAELGSPNYVMVVRVAALGQSMPEPTGLNDNVYRMIE